MELNIHALTIVRRTYCKNVDLKSNSGSIRLSISNTIHFFMLPCAAIFDERI